MSLRSTILLLLAIAVLAAIEQPACAVCDGKSAPLSGGANDKSRVAQAMKALIEESVVVENADAIRLAAMNVSAHERYEMLRGWVLPSETHDTIRFSASFVATSMIDRAGGRGNLISSAIDLIEVAKDLGKLDELSAAITSCQSLTERQQRSRLALLTLVKIQQSDFVAATMSMSELADRHQAEAFPELQGRWPETIVVMEAVQHPELWVQAEELLQKIFQDQVRPGKFNGPDSWDRLILSLVGRLQFEKQAAQSGVRTEAWGHIPNLREWFPVSSTDAGLNGLGCPVSHWQRDGTNVVALSHHFNDYLYYYIPLLGNFQVECDLGGFNYRDSQLMVAGTWIGPAPSHDKLLNGTVRQELPTQSIDPRLSEIGDWLRMRVEVTENDRTTYINGRKVHHVMLSACRDPWLAVRVPFHSFGTVRNICITGEPVIPNTLNLSSDDRLSGWTSYYGGDFGRPRVDDWWHEVDDAGRSMIAGNLEPFHAGDAKESLLQYHRPMMEDGEIEYDFYYEPGLFHVHPVLGRRAFLLHPKGVKIHWITDAHFDRNVARSLTDRDPSGADPLNESSLPNDGKSSDLPLLPGKWNHIALKLQGNVVSLAINGASTVSMSLPVEHNVSESWHNSSSTDCTFGLFHYLGETGVRVHNIRWTGDWSKSLPALKDQELRNKSPDELDATLPKLPVVFSHDFTESGLPDAVFEIQDRGADQFVSLQSDGLHVDARMKTQGYSRVCVTPRFFVYGDFDMTAVFAELRIVPTEHGAVNAMLQIGLTDDSISHHAISLSDFADPGRPLRSTIDHQLLQLKPFYIGYLEQRSEEVRSGTMRLARRGDKMYSLLAAGDSKEFRLIHVEKCVRDRSRFDGARLVTGMNSSVNGLTQISVVWKSLTVQAERLEGPAAPKSIPSFK